MGAKPWYDWVFRWRRAWDSNPRTVFGRQTISSRSRYDLFDSPPYISTVFRALRKCKKNTQEQYEILKFDPAKTLINQGFSAEKTARANAHFESVPLWPLRYVSGLFVSELQWEEMLLILLYFGPKCKSRRSLKCPEKIKDFEKSQKKNWLFSPDVIV